jgi:site-specific DNA recombinase
MIAAIYARKSTEQRVADVEKSVTRQLDLRRAFAAEKGWTVIEEYVDDGVSGRATAHLVNRARMLSDASAGKFSALIVRDYDRLSRDDREGPAFVYALQDAGVDLWEYTTKAPIDTGTAMKRGMLG